MKNSRRVGGSTQVIHNCSSIHVFMIFSLNPAESTAKSSWGYTVLLPFSALKEAWVIDHDFYLFLGFGIVYYFYIGK